ncbi:MAG: XdhC family protein [Candidatus Dormibacteria bacterium]
MRDLIPSLDDWAVKDPDIAIATVIRTGGSTPRGPGARLLVSRDGRMSGSVSGGCLEADVVLAAQAVLEGRAPARVLHYGISDEAGWAVGLACGGTVDVFIESVRWDGRDPVLRAVREAIDLDRPVALVSVVAGEHTGSRAALTSEGNIVGTLGTVKMEAAQRAATVRLDSGVAGVDEIGGVPIFIDPVVRDPQLVLIGAVHIAISLARMAAAAGYRVTVIDPRAPFLTAERIPDAHRLVRAWPRQALTGISLGPRDAAVCLAHDSKFEDPALSALLGTQVGYVGAIGSRTTHAKRVTRLRAAGFDDRNIQRIHSPVGLDIGAVTPAEIALSILVEVVAVRHARSGGSLSAR